MLSDTDALRFWSKVKKTDEGSDDCWLWQASLSAGYGQFIIGGRGGKLWKSHRISWVEAFGWIPDGLLVLHRCDVRACVRPSHLFVGTHQDNMDDMYAKGRDRTRAKPRKSRKLSDAQVLEIRADNRLLRLIAAQHGVSVALVSQIKNKRRRQYIC